MINSIVVTPNSLGQTPPPNIKPRVTTTLWEDEGTLCFQVEAKGISVARREDNNMINGTKLLNVAGMTRGRRDGILKSEKVRHVVKIGTMYLKGVWIPYERALEFSAREKIVDLLYPLFVADIKSFLYHPLNYTRTVQVLAAAERKKQVDQMRIQQQQQAMVAAAAVSLGGNQQQQQQQQSGPHQQYYLQSAGPNMMYPAPGAEQQKLQQQQPQYPGALVPVLHQPSQQQQQQQQQQQLQPPKGASPRSTSASVPLPAIGLNEQDWQQQQANKT